MALVTKTILQAGGEDYTSIAAWETATNLNSDADIWQGNILDSTNDYDEAVVINGGGTATTSYVWLTSDSTVRHAGAWTTSKSRINYSGGDTAVIQIDSDYAQVDWQQIHRPTSGSMGNSDEGFRVTSTAEDSVLLSYNIIWTDNGTTDSDTDGIYVGNWAITKLSIDNCIWYGWERNDLHFQQFTTSGSLSQTINLDHNVAFWAGASSIEAPLSVRQESGTTTMTMYNNVFLEDLDGTDRDIAIDDGATGDVVTLNGSNNCFNTISETGSGTTNNNLTSTQAATAGPLDTDTANGFIVNDATFDPVAAATDLTLQDLANNVALTNGTNRQGSEPDSRQDFSLDITGGARGTTDVDIGADQVTAGAAVSKDVTDTFSLSGELLTITATLTSLADTASVAEGTTVITATLDDDDTGSLSGETATLTATLNASDTASTTEGTSSIAASLDATDSLAVDEDNDQTVDTSAVDAATLTEDMDVDATVAITMSDTMSVAEGTTTIAGTLDASDSLAVDEDNNQTVDTSAVDAATVADTIDVEAGQLLNLTDTFTVTEGTTTIAADLDASDSGSVGEGTPGVGQDLTDAFTLAEDFDLDTGVGDVSKSASDAFSLSGEELTITVTLTSTDSMSLSVETATLTATLDGSDTATFAEGIPGIAQDLTDALSLAVETATLAGTFTRTDGFTLADELSLLAVSLTAVDTFTVTEGTFTIDTGAAGPGTIVMSSTGPTIVMSSTGPSITVTSTGASVAVTEGVF